MMLAHITKCPNIKFIITLVANNGVSTRSAEMQILMIIKMIMSIRMAWV
jgi:hypothetical protein